MGKGRDGDYRDVQLNRVVNVWIEMNDSGYADCLSCGGPAGVIPPYSSHCRLLSLVPAISFLQTLSVVSQLPVSDGSKLDNKSPDPC